MTLTDFLQPFGPALTFSPRLCPILGGSNPTISLSYLLSCANNPEGRVRRTAAEIRQATGLTRSEQETARKRLKARGFLEETGQGLPRQLSFRVHREALARAWRRHRETAPENAGHPPCPEDEADGEDEPAPDDLDTFLLQPQAPAPTEEDPGCHAR